MKIKELISVIVDTVAIYKSNDEGFEDIYIGNTKDIPVHILEMKVRLIGSSKKADVDIQVF